ncbi:THO complex subunit 2 [Geosmithia morbida]|uniref:THO complex subunit 2 n=1 Tax=Geosmithia morbida TaxID=1094350 RepID=A0A9P4YVV5_9HYPO|nr:THO complex subunit 2 [Geosmithia morbida]KAF4122980.1 THO complex subunit 2 [Geosmithia morbida]
MPPKRKRPERAPSDAGRPSPHRPGDTSSMAQYDRDDPAGRGRGRGIQRGAPNNGNHTDSPTNQAGRRVYDMHNGSPSPQSRIATAESRPVPPQAPTRQPAPVQASTAQEPPTLSGRYYEHLSEERLSKWAAGGRDEVIAHGCQSRQDLDITELSTIVQEFIHAVVERRMDAKDAGACVKEILGPDAEDKAKGPFFAPHALLIDSLALILDTNTNKFHPSLRTFLLETGVSVALIRQYLDAPVLQQLGLVRDHFIRVGVRQATNLLYRQANYNLLREETEGYSKLITELYMTSDALHPDVPQEIFERIKGLIGTFDLDVGRVLDVTLDVSAAVLVKQFKFFVKLLRVSSWWPRPAPKSPECPFVGGLPTWATPGYPQWTTTEEDEAANISNKRARDVAFWDRARKVHLTAFFELGGRQLTASAIENGATNGADPTDPGAEAERQWMDITKSLPPSGNHVAAHLLGFKLLFYHSNLRDPSDVLPANLLYLAALLIKIGFISLPDLYPHLSPDDDKMEKVREKKMEEIEEAERKARGGGQANALLMAGVLPQGDDDNPNAVSAPRKEAVKKTEAEKKQEAAEAAATAKGDEPHEQKVSLLIQLLTIGALPESLFILGRFPWIPEAFPEVLDCIHRILHVCVSKLYAESRPVAVISTECPMKNVADYDQSGLPKGSVRLTRMTTKKVLRWPTADKLDHNETQDYRYYWDEWTDNVPVCQTIDDLFTLCDTFLNISGVNIGRDAALVTKIATIGAKSLYQDSSDSNMTRWRELLKRLLLPALSHTKANTSAVDAVWNILRRYPTTVRFALYAEWFEGQISRLPAMKSAFSRAQAETRATMKRVSLTNLSEMAKRLAKTSFSSPGIVFSVAFEQLESYPNLIEAFVECAKYFTNLSYDVLVWSLLNSLGKSRSRTQADHALTTSKWLQALSRFVGKVYRRYSVLTPVPVLNYVNEQLLRGNSTDLIILREFITSMGGIVDSGDFTDQQVLAMTGGEYLRRQTLIRGQDKRFENIRSSQRLIRSLADTELAAQILLNLAQYRQAALFKVDDGEAHIKLLSSIVDDSHRILTQYLDFLWSNLDHATFEKIVPSIPELMTTFGLEAGLAFLIGRPSLSHRMLPWKTKEPTESKDQPEKLTPDGDVAMSDVPPTEGTPDVSAREPEVTEVQKNDDPSLIRAALNPIVESVQASMPPEIWAKISPDVYVTFWALQLGDLFCPDKIYRQETNRLKSEEAAVARDRTDMSRKGQERKMEKRKELMQLQIDLSEECGEHMLRQAKWKFHLSKQFQSAFPEPRASPESIADTLLEHCFIPRVLISPADAEYTFKFIKSLHEWNAPGFKLKALYDRLFNANRLRLLIFAASVREVENLGRFFKLILEDLLRWHKNEPVSLSDNSTANPNNNKKTTSPAKDQQQQQPRLGAYDKEGKGTAEQPRLGFALTTDENGKPQTFVEHPEFQNLLFSWHKNLNMALKSCLGGTEWMHIRNAITVLRTILDSFPVIDFMGKQFSTQLQEISRKEAASKTGIESEEAHRVDLSVAAQGALSELQRRKAKWMMVQAFRPSIGGAFHKVADRTDLRPTAPEFKPKPDTDKPAAAADEEDGEVPDGAKAKPVETKPTETTAGSGETTSSSDAHPHKSVTSLPTGPREGSAPINIPTRSSTPKQGPSASQGKAEARSSTLPDRPPHNLPIRPDVPIPGHYSERYPHGQQRTTDRRDVRGPRDARERETRDPRDGREQQPHRDPREGWHGDVEWNDRNRANSGSAGQEPSMNPERAALFRQEGQDRPPRSAVRDTESPNVRGRRPPPHNDTPDNVNPARPGLVGEGADNTPSRGPREMAREMARDRTPRTSSPRRSGGRYPEGSDQDHARPPSRPHPADGRSGGRQPRERSPHAPRNYREGDRGGAPLPDKGSARDPPFPRDGPDYDHRAGQHEDQNYGRLNPIQLTATTGEIPSGPRGRGRGARAHGPMPPGPPDNSSGRYAPGFGSSSSQRMPSPQPTERQPPTGPSGRASSRRGYEPGPPGPSTPASSANAVQPERVRNLNNTSSEAHAAPAAGVHPDRLAQLGGGGGGDNSRNAPTPPSSSAPDRSSRSSNDTRPAPSTPSAPETATERGRSGGSKRQLAGINNMLQANRPAETARSSGGSSSRRSGRSTLGNSDIQILTGGSPTAAAAPTLSSEDFTRGSRDRESRSDRRSSRRSSRDRSSNKDHHRERDYRDRRASESGSGAAADRESSRRRGAPPPPPPPPLPSSESMGPPHSAQGGQGREPMLGRTGGKDDHHGSSRRDDYRGRKRRSEDANGHERDKRQRR